MQSNNYFVFSKEMLNLLLCPLKTLCKLEVMVELAAAHLLLTGVIGNSRVPSIFNVEGRQTDGFSISPLILVAEFSGQLFLSGCQVASCKGEIVQFSLDQVYVVLIGFNFVPTSVPAALSCTYGWGEIN